MEVLLINWDSWGFSDEEGKFLQDIVQYNKYCHNDLLMLVLHRKMMKKNFPLEHIETYLLKLQRHRLLYASRAFYPLYYASLRKDAEAALQLITRYFPLTMKSMYRLLAESIRANAVVMTTYLVEMAPHVLYQDVDHPFHDNISSLVVLTFEHGYGEILLLLLKHGARIYSKYKSLNLHMTMLRWKGPWFIQTLFHFHGASFPLKTNSYIESVAKQALFAAEAMILATQNCFIADFLLAM